MKKSLWENLPFSVLADSNVHNVVVTGGHSYPFLTWQVLVIRDTEINPLSTQNSSEYTKKVQPTFSGTKVYYMLGLERREKMWKYLLQATSSSSSNDPFVSFALRLLRDQNPALRFLQQIKRTNEFQTSVNFTTYKASSKSEVSYSFRQQAFHKNPVEQRHESLQRSLPWEKTKNQI